MSDTPASIVWFRRDLRLSDHAALTAACNAGGPVFAVFIHDAQTEALGAAAKWRLQMALKSLGDALLKKGHKLILRRGNALDVLQTLLDETGARAVHWLRAYEPDSIARDTKIKAALKAKGIAATSHAGTVMFEPMSVQTGQGGYYKVYSPFWRAVAGRDVAPPLPAPSRIPAPEIWPVSDRLTDWGLSEAMNRGADVLHLYTQIGEDAAQNKLAEFLAERVDAYKARRDFPAENATSDMSQHLTVGEISASQCWHGAMRMCEEGAAGAEHFMKELVWREFAYHLMYHTPKILTENWREGWDEFPWNTDETRADVIAWKQGRTGQPFVDAAMREMYVTGRMHNRARMIVGSYLTKHLMTHWRVGQAWFADCLTDWDAASNAMGWQWVAGCGPDAAPYFRVFNPETQAEKFDKSGAYRKSWISELSKSPPKSALDYFAAIPRSWDLRPEMAYATERISLKEGRDRALTAYGARA